MEHSLTKKGNGCVVHEWCLNPYFNGTLSDAKAVYAFQLVDVLILILMEHSLTTYNGNVFEISVLS